MIQIPIGQWEWAFFGWICLLPLVFFIVAILLCVWVYRDAESRGMSGVLWLIIVLITGIIGLIIYLIVRKEKAPPGPPAEKITRVCTSCGRVVAPDIKFCPHCGKELPE